MSFRVWRFGDDPAVVREVVAAGGVVALPTESSYGLAVDPANPLAVEHVFRLKGRAPDKRLPVIAADRGGLPSAARVRSGIESLLAGLWPAPLSLVLDVDQPLAAAGDGGTLAVRVPAHDDLRELLQATGPLTATSANRSGETPALEPETAGRLLRSAECTTLLVDGGRLPGGPPSTLVRVDGDRWHVLRPGALSEDWIRERVGRSSTAFVENSADG